MRDFEKISYKQFCKDVKEDEKLYNEYKLPIRDSIASAGYDILLLEDIELKPNETIKISTGIKAYFENDGYRIGLAGALGACRPHHR